MKKIKKREIEVRQISKRLEQLRKFKELSAGIPCWSKYLRHGLGMSVAQLAERVGIGRSTLSEAEQREHDGTITLKKLKEIATALNCDLVYAFVPKEKIEDQIEEQARMKALQSIAASNVHMELEDQKVAASDERLKEIIEEKRAQNICGIKTMSDLKFREKDGSTPLDKEQLKGIKFPHVTLMSELDELEDANIQRGMDWLNHNKSENYLSIEFLNELHKKLFGDVWKWAGTFRKTEVNLSTVQPYNIGPMLKNLFEDVKYQIESKSISWEELIAEFHHRLVTIHPYPNGNGRTTRLITEYLEKRTGHQITSWKRSLNKDPKEKRRQYILALRTADKGDYTQLIEFMSEKT